MEIKYTDSGKKELQAFLDRQKTILEEQIKKEKYVFGDDIVEIVSRDVKEASDQIRVVPKNRSIRYSSTKLLLKLYFIFGVLLALFGLFNEQIMFIIETRQKGLTYMFAGVVLALVSWLGIFYVKQKEERTKQDENELRKK